MKMKETKILNKVKDVVSVLKNATVMVNDIDAFNKAHKKAMKKLVAECPYCDPDWYDVPNFPEAMKGYDLPMGNPDPGINVISNIISCKVYLT